MAAGPTVKKLLLDCPGQIQLVMKHTPYEPREHALPAAQAALAAWAQGKYWEMHDQLLAGFPNLEREALLRMASEIGLDMVSFSRALDTGAHAAHIARDKTQAAELGVFGTPTFFINGRQLMGNPPYPLLQQMVEEELARGGGRRIPQ